MKTLFLALAMLSTTTVFASIGKTFSADVKFSYDLFNDEAKCEMAQRQWHVNCFQTLTLMTNGQAMLMVTDIMNVGTYEIVEDKVVVTMNSPTELNQLTFILSSNKKFLIEEGTTKVWEPETK